MIMYQLTDLGESPISTFDQSKARAINVAGQCVGNWFSFDGTVHSRGFLGSDQQAPTGVGIFPLIGHMSQANDINDAGLVVGGHWQPTSPTTKHDGVFLYSATSTITQDITPSIAQSIAIEQIFPFAINNNGVILGSIHEPEIVGTTRFTFDTKNADNEFRYRLANLSTTSTGTTSSRLVGHRQPTSTARFTRSTVRPTVALTRSTSSITSSARPKRKRSSSMLIRSRSKSLAHWRGHTP